MNRIQLVEKLHRDKLEKDEKEFKLKTKRQKKTKKES